MEKKEKKSKKKFLLTIIIILFLIMVLLFIFRNNIEAQYKGIDPKYIENPQYCEQDSDCFKGWSKTCGGLGNIYQDHGYVSCKLAQCGPIICKNNQCVMECNNN